jgi:hypothetical protein
MRSWRVGALTQPLGSTHSDLKDQVLGNVTTLIAHRQVIPESAEQIAAIAGTMQ